LNSLSLDFINQDIILAALAVLSFLYFNKKRKKEKYSHKWRRKSSVVALQKLQSINHHGKFFSYLRKIDPFVVEEIILNAIEVRSDIEVIRNEKYTGDGGVDGRFNYTPNNQSKKKHLCLVQVKRYKSYVNAKDINTFHDQIMKEGALFGLFVHTGKSGKGVHNNIAESCKIKLISGNKLIDLIKDASF